MADTEPTSALYACLTCRKQKRKCSRELPVCSLCKKNGRSCEYRVSDHNKSTPSDDPRPVIARSRSPINRPQSRQTVAPPSPSSSSITTATPSATHRQDASAWFFLDHYDFQRKKLTLPPPNAELPHEFSHVLETSSLMFNVDVYFNSVHTFLPIVSKLRLYRELSVSQNNLSADLTLLLIAMQLHTKSLHNGEPQNGKLYKTAKAACSHVECNNTLSVALLQATLLVALYEIEHAIYPAAYLTVGHCARLGLAMGLHNRKRAPQMLSTPTTSTEWEERRRSWWAVIVLDRYIHLGSRDRSFACEDARPEEILPVDEKHWDQGALALVQPLALSANNTVQASPFARTCQASHLLSRVLRHVNDRDANDEFRYQEASQLHRTLQALCTTIATESESMFEKSSDTMAKLPLFTANALCYSALLCLYELYCCAEGADPSQYSHPAFIEMQRLGIAGVKETSYNVYRFSQNIKSVAELGGMLKMSPLVCDCLYQAAANYAWLAGETSSEDDISKLATIKNVLGMLGKRWKLAGEYKNMIDHYEQSFMTPS
ncbi:hypothetical protein BGZ63DRAFT_509973 [Mariannaea sp. PMI_226]|nr:hypothetical protein BGZ63DRAFT_509973 [Mariannaea sp. PMI_226]